MKKLLAAVVFLVGVICHAEKPNVVLVMADDMGYECLSVNGGKPFKTPNLDRIAKEGVRFTQAYSNAMCTPSRVKIMSGRYNCRNYEMFAHMNPNIYTIGNLMRDAGYQTAIVGKWQLNGYGDFAVPDAERWPRMNKSGFDEFCMWQCKLGSSATPDRYHQPLLEQNGMIRGPELKGRYGPDVLMDFACDYISRKKDKPFFIYYPMMLPHSPFVPTPDSDDPNCKDNNRNYADMVAYVDKLMGKLFQCLEKEGELDNTLFLFTGDNGTAHNLTRHLGDRKLTTGKSYLTDDGTRAILVAYWKNGMKAGQVCDDLIDFSDFMPTLADAAGVKPPADTDGVSFLPQIKGQQGNPRKWIVAEHDTGTAAQYEKTGRWARTREYKLYQKGSRLRDGGFYNTKLDPDETNDLSGSSNPEVAAVKKELAAVLASLPAWNSITPKEDKKSLKAKREKEERQKKRKQGKKKRK